jgi:hypothetical protein
MTPKTDEPNKALNHLTPTQMQQKHWPNDRNIHHLMDKSTT